jgi:hypothetical protein
MAPSLRFDAVRRRRRLMVRHRLGPTTPAASVAAVAEGLVALHSTDPATVFLSIAARMADASPAAVEDALYEQRSVVRMLGMRRTVFVVPVDLAAVVHAACTTALVPGERKRLVALLEAGGIAEDGAAWLEEVSRATFDAIVARGEAVATELTAAVPELRAQVSVGEGRTWAGTIGMSTRVLFLRAAEGSIVRGRPRGSWVSSQYRWSPMSAWRPGGLPELAVADARATLVRRWLRAYGPGTVADIKWWTGLTVGEVRKALAQLATVEVDLEGSVGVALADDVDDGVEDGADDGVDDGVGGDGQGGAGGGGGDGGPVVTFLPALDPTPMGWTDRSWFLGPHRAALFDRSGNIGPTVWLDGRVVGGWAQRADGEVVSRLLEDLGREVAAAAEAEAAWWTAWLGPARVKPRFRTPLERELSG